MRHRHTPRDSGATAVEFTLVFLFVVLPIIMLGAQYLLATSSRQQATAAARDGARAGIVRYADVDVANSPGNTAVGAAIDKRLGFGVATSALRCVNRSVVPVTTVDCVDAIPGRDALEVVVTMPTVRVVPAFRVGPINFDSLLPSSVSGVSTEVVANP